jgi:hypothetical protein
MAWWDEFDIGGLIESSGYYAYGGGDAPPSSSFADEVAAVEEAAFELDALADAIDELDVELALEIAGEDVEAAADALWDRRDEIGAELLLEMYDEHISDVAEGMMRALLDYDADIVRGYVDEYGYETLWLLLVDYGIDDTIVDMLDAFIEYENTEIEIVEEADGRFRGWFQAVSDAIAWCLDVIGTTEYHVLVVDASGGFEMYEPGKEK